MATTKVTVTLDDEQLDAVRRAVARGEARSISGFVKHAVSVALDDVAGWRAMLDEALNQTGGPLTKREIAWADSVLAGGRPRPKRKRKAA